MHRALTVSDVVCLIVEFTAAGSVHEVVGGEPLDRATRRALRKLLTLNRTFSEPVLDTLWKTSTPWRLARAMPVEMFYINAIHDLYDLHLNIDGYRMAHSRLDAGPRRTRYYIVSASIMSLQ
jgi:hypothetical protein